MDAQRSDTSSPLDAAIAANLQAVRRRICRAAERAGRSPEGVRLVAVSKTFGADVVRAAATAGHREFGENRVQEAAAKVADTTALDLRWHLIGHLQSNKSKKAVTLFSCIHSVDRVELLRKLDTEAGAAGTAPELLVQVDLAKEPTKHGAEPAEVLGILEAARDCRAIRVVGLMLMPPYTPDPERVRPYFRGLRQLASSLLDSGVDPLMLRELSMGMSHDFEAAIEEGSTIIRVGTAIFGTRTKP